jgi:purine-binding chemotaxis protein CheW
MRESDMDHGARPPGVPQLRATLPPGDDALTGVLVLKLEGREYGFPLDHVLEVVRMVALAPLPEAPSWVHGLLNLRGRTVPVIDLRVRLGLPRREPDLSTAIVVTTTGSGLLGLIADELVEVVFVAPHELDPAGIETAASPCVIALARLGDRLILLLDVDRVREGSSDAIERTTWEPMAGRLEAGLP